MEVEVREAEVSLLDLLLVVAENIKLLVLGPLLAGLVALGIGFVLPQNYVSQAILLVPPPTSPNLPSPAQAAAMMMSPLVLDPIIGTDPELSAKPLETARKDLAGKLKAAVAKDGLLRLDATANQPQAAQALANAVIDNWLKSTVPGPQDRADLEKRFSYASNALASVTTLLNTLSVDGAVSLGKPLTRGEAGTSLVGLGELQTRYLNDVLGIPRALQGLSRDVVKQPPTLPIEPASNKKALIAVMTTLGTGFALLLFVFMRQAWRNAAKDPAAASKIERLRAAVGGTPRY